MGCNCGNKRIKKSDKNNSQPIKIGSKIKKIWKLSENTVIVKKTNNK